MNQSGRPYLLLEARSLPLFVMLKNEVSGGDEQKET
jgi:hypothetical protein